MPINPYESPQEGGTRQRSRWMFRPAVIVVTAAACIGVGVLASVMAFGSLLTFPLSPANFDYATSDGVRCRAVAAVIAAGCLFAVDQRYLVVAAVIAVALTWLVTFASVFLYVAMGLG